MHIHISNILASAENDLHNVFYLDCNNVYVCVAQVSIPA